MPIESKLSQKKKMGTLMLSLETTTETSTQDFKGVPQASETEQMDGEDLETEETREEELETAFLPVAHIAGSW